MAERDVASQVPYGRVTGYGRIRAVFSSGQARRLVGVAHSVTGAPSRVAHSVTGAPSRHGRAVDLSPELLTIMHIRFT